MNNYNKILDECIDLILYKKYTIQECLEKYPDLRQNLSEDLQISIKIKNEFEANVNEESKMKAKNLLLDKFRTQSSYKSRIFKIIPSKLSNNLSPIITKWSSIAAAILIFSTVGTTSLVSASSESNPDENLYPVKRAVENIRLTFTVDQGKKNELRLGYSHKRMSEITDMVDKGAFGRVRSLQEDLVKNIETISITSDEIVVEKIYEELKNGYISKEEAEKVISEHIKTTFQNKNKSLTDGIVANSKFQNSDITYPRKERILKLKQLVKLKETRIKELCEKIEKFDSEISQKRMNRLEQNDPEKWNEIKTRQENILENCKNNITKHTLYKERLSKLMTEKVTAKYLNP